MNILTDFPADQLTVWYNLASFNPHVRFKNEMAPVLWTVAMTHSLDPVVVLAQAGKETGWGNYTGKVPPTFFNTCGLKIHNPALAGDQESTMAHAQFASWEVGALAHCQHLLAYCQVRLATGEPLVDPRWVHVFGKKPAIIQVEELGGKWAPSPTYGTELAAIVTKLKGV